MNFSDALNSVKAGLEISREEVSLNFSDALNSVKAGSEISREGWNGKGQFVKLQSPDENSKMGLPYLYIKTVEGKLVPWLASQTDLLANDWLATPV